MHADEKWSNTATQTWSNFSLETWKPILKDNYNECIVLKKFQWYWQIGKPNTNWIFASREYSQFEGPPHDFVPKSTDNDNCGGRSVDIPTGVTGRIQSVDRYICDECSCSRSVLWTKHTIDRSIWVNCIQTFKLIHVSEWTRLIWSAVVRWIRMFSPNWISWEVAISWRLVSMHSKFLNPISLCSKQLYEPVAKDANR